MSSLHFRETVADRGADWDAFVQLYRQSFPEPEREPLQTIGERLRSLDIDAVSYQVPEYGLRVVDTIEEAVEAFGDLDAADVILVKASRMAGLERAAALLRG